MSVERPLPVTFGRRAIMVSSRDRSDGTSLPIFCSSWGICPCGKIAGAAQGPALGSAIFGAVAAGKAAGGYDDVFAAARDMGKVKELSYKPIAENAKAYDRLFAEYRVLHDYFGRGANDVMKRLKKLKAEV